MNFGYMKGRRFEYKIKKYWESKGYVVLRMAGSHGFADLVAIHPTEKKVAFIQCKAKRMSLLESSKLEAEMDTITGVVGIQEDYAVMNYVESLGEKE